jgi:molecular chaperone GrpE
VGGRLIRPPSKGEINVSTIEVHGIGQQTEDMDGSSSEERPLEGMGIKKVPEKEADVTEMGGEEHPVDDAVVWKDKYLRQYAELENTKKRLSRKLQIELLEKTSALLMDLLPVADNLERILRYAREIEDEELERGLKITLEAFQDAMAKHGVSKMEVRGKLFNPEYHEALGAVPSQRFEEGTVLEVEQTGYLLDGKVLRPAKVVIVSG